MSLPKITGRLTSYQIGLGSLFIIPAIPAAIYLMLGYQAQPTLAEVSVIVLVGMLAAVWARGLIDRTFPIEITPPVRSHTGQFIVLVVTYLLIKVIANPIINAQVSSLASVGSGSQLAVLTLVPIEETLVIQYFLFYGFLAAGMLLFKRNYWLSMILATLIATPWAYEFHYWVYNAIPAVWNWVFASFIILNVSYGLTGNIVVPMIAHLLIDALGLTLVLLLPSICPGFWGLC